MTSFQDIIALWGTPGALADDLKEPSRRVWAWKERDSIPARYWTAVVSAAEKRGFDGVTADVLAEIAAASSDKVPA